jgi:hypothetical protein
MRWALAGLLLVAALVAPASAAAGQVWFLRDGRPVPVARPVAGADAALRSLLRGPTPAERRLGIQTALPSGLGSTRLSIRRRVVTLDLPARVAAPGTDAALRDRVRQLVRTLDGVPGVLAVRVRVLGGVPVGLFPGLQLTAPVTASALPAEPHRTAVAVERRLDDLGFMPPGTAPASAGERLAVAVLAFEKWAGLERDGVLSRADERRLLAAPRPEPVRQAGAGRRIEVLLDRQVALLVEHDRVLRVVHISTGAWATSTPAGSFRVYRKERYSWSVPFEVWMPWASYFTGGIAFHEYPYVPAWPASHGCVRVNRFDARGLFAFARHGTPVLVVAGT